MSCRRLPTRVLVLAVLTYGLATTEARAASRYHQSTTAEIVADEARRQLGSQWAPLAVAIARAESGLRCNATGPSTRSGRARGVMQVMPRTAEALERGSSRRLHDCRVGARVGVKHMAACIRSGARTQPQVAACHLAGVGGWRNPTVKQSRYMQRYVREVMR